MERSEVRKFIGRYVEIVTLKGDRIRGVISFKEDNENVIIINDFCTLNIGFIERINGHYNN